MTLQQTLAAIHTLGIKCSRATLVSRLKTWEFTKYLKSEDTPSLRVQLAYLFWIKCFNDKQILRVIHFTFISQYLNNLLIKYYVQILKQEGYDIEHRRLVLIRKSMGMLRRLPKEKLTSEADLKLQEVLEKELQDGNITLNGRRTVWIHLRNMGILASRYNKSSTILYQSN